MTQYVPITPSVLAWAVQESGYSGQEVAREVGVDPQLLEDWISSEDKRPNKTQFGKLVALLKRPAATFFLPRPPKVEKPSVELRTSLGVKSRSKSPVEREAIRDAHRVQKIVAWLKEQLAADVQAQLPTASTNDNPEHIAEQARSWVGVSVQHQLDWSSVSVAFHSWRKALESKNLLVFAYSLGESAVQGFSISHRTTPLVAVSISWPQEVRVYSLIHELAHLITNTNSACEQSSDRSPTKDPVERWCERFAAAFLMPIEGVSTVLSEMKLNSTPLQKATRLSNTFRVSRTSAVLRLIERNEAGWGLFNSLPKGADRKRRTSGGGGGGRQRRQIRLETYGGPTFDWIKSGLEENLISDTEATSYLRLSEDEI